MNKKKKKMIAVFLVISLFFAPFYTNSRVMADDTEEAALSSSTGKVMRDSDVYNKHYDYYTWKKATSDSDLSDYLSDGREHKVIIAWEDGGNYFLGDSGSGMHKKKLQGCWMQDIADFSKDGFSTFANTEPSKFSSDSADRKKRLEDSVTFSVTFQGWKKDTKGSRYKTKIKIGGEQLYWEYDQNKAVDLGSSASGVQDKDYGDDWVVEPKGGKFCIFANIPRGYDTAFAPDKNMIDIVTSDAKAEFYIYMLVKEEKIDSFKDNLTIEAEDTLSISQKERVLLREGGTITVKEGGLLSVSGTLFLQGNIDNHGTVLVNGEGAVSTIVSKFLSGNGNTSQGRIVCEGQGSMIVLSGGMVVMNESASDGNLVIKNGGGLLNYGTIILDNTLQISGGNVYNRSTGMIFSGYDVTERTRAEYGFTGYFKPQLDNGKARVVGFCPRGKGGGIARLFATDAELARKYAPLKAEQWGVFVGQNGYMLNEGYMTFHSALYVSDDSVFETPEGGNSRKLSYCILAEEYREKDPSDAPGVFMGKLLKDGILAYRHSGVVYVNEWINE